MVKKKSKKEYQYYLNPITDDLVILDVKSSEIIAVPMIEEVSYEGTPYTEGEESHTEGEEAEEPTKPKKSKKTRKGRINFDPETLMKIKDAVQIRKMNAQELVEEFDICLTAAYKYHKKFKSEFKPLKEAALPE